MPNLLMIVIFSGYKGSKSPKDSEKTKSNKRKFIFAFVLLVALQVAIIYGVFFKKH